eukprot:TRINITY_DN26530_c0_g1_i1.p1 TRINITY_DN26530_c0_g1~~TRINITY_DN26530_c0_g1_i1.p1  ORF type:complete len:1428 (-),score=259.66 TRINITY_DN26530_c0_g1_i1:341-4579(-)
MEGAKVYVQDASGAWQKATVVAALGAGRSKVRLQAWEGAPPAATDGSEIEVDASSMEGGSLPFQNANMPDDGFPNMTTLDHLHEAAILHNLRVRFFAGSCPYTYTADIVIAMNPYRWFPELFTDEKRKEYLVFDRSNLPPHAYATSSAAYFGLQETKKAQAILVSGESGAGKTETVKILMAHLAQIASSEDSTHIKRIVESNPLLESFGNAQTVRNDNSSRFGKFIELELDKGCHLVGSKCRTYLLEKSRVVGQDAGERNYHIFYQMLAADPQLRNSYGLSESTYTRDTMRYTRLGKSSTDTIEGKSDAARFAHTCSALGLVGVEGDLLTKLLQALAGVLLLGELEFEGDESASLLESSKEKASHVAATVQVDSEGLVHALTKRTLKMRNESVIKQLTPAEASGTKDAVAKELYSRLFDWLVGKICAATKAHGGDAVNFIGLLDIFGFESFAINRFEQLCINYANEKLQQKFTLDVFKAVQQEYADEGIPWDRIEFKDNAPLLELIEAKLGIVAMLNEECVRPKGSDENFVSKLSTVHKEATRYFSRPKLGAQKELQFTIQHYAGSVTYTATGWLERNKDSISDDVVMLLRGSGNALVAEVFAELDPSGSGASDPSAKKSTGSATVVTKFKTSLTQLMETVGQTHTQYVRCIKPNKVKSPIELDNAMVIEQLRCAGVIEAIRVSRAGFPARMTLKEFLQRFQILAKAAAGRSFPRAQSIADPDGTASQAAAEAVASLKTSTDPTAACRSLVAALVPKAKQVEKGAHGSFEVGRTRVYFKAGVLEQLEERRTLLQQAAANEISRRVRGGQARHAYLSWRHAALTLQASQRMHHHRVAFLKIRRAALLLQRKRRRLLSRRLNSALRIQAQHRRRVAMRAFQHARGAAVRIQARTRRNACRRQYLRDLVEAKEQAKLENQVRALQQKLAAQEAAFKEAALNQAAQHGPSAESAEPPKELLDTLSRLQAENQKLRAENEKQRTEISHLKKENQQLRAEQSARGDVLNSIQWEREHKQARGDEAAEGRNASMEPQARRSSSGQSLQGQGPKSPSRSSAVPAPAAAGTTSWLYKPLWNFWQDVECSMIPLIKSGSEVHIKLGANIVMVEETSKNQSLTWMPCMNKADGYRRSMAFYIERPADIGSADNSLGKAFTLRSALTLRYVSLSRTMQGLRLRASGSRPEEAAVFTYEPLAATSMSDGVGLADEVGSAVEHLCFIQLNHDKKLLRLSTDGHVVMQAVQDSDMTIRNTRITASFEQLLTRGCYEIEVEQQHIGITLSKETPLKVVSLVDWPVSKANGPPAVTSGRVHAGDILSSVSGQDVRGIPCNDVLDMIACKRPVTLGFTVGTMGPPPAPGEATGPPGMASSHKPSDHSLGSPEKRKQNTTSSSLSFFFTKRKSAFQAPAADEPARPQTITL